MKKLLLLILISLFAFACEQAGEADSAYEKAMITNAEKFDGEMEAAAEFMVTFVNSAMSIRKSSNAYLTKSGNEAVADLARSMDQQYGDLRTEAEALGAEMAIVLPNQIRPQDQLALNEFIQDDSAESDFDKEYLDMLDDELDKIEDSIDGGAREVTNEQLNTFIAKVATTVESHQQKVDELQGDTALSVE